MLLLIYRMPTERANERAPRLFQHERDNRTLIVYLPPTYEAEPERRFPVLYMQDGQNLFDPQTSREIIGAWARPRMRSSRPLRLNR